MINRMETVLNFGGLHVRGNPHTVFCKSAFRAILPVRYVETSLHEIPGSPGISGPWRKLLRRSGRSYLPGPQPPVAAFRPRGWGLNEVAPASVARNLRPC